MTTPLRIAALVLAPLAACVVSTSDFAPKTAADCQSWEKPCGYKCVNAGDPGTGCGNASCDPVDIQTDAANCGACGHSCAGSTCGDGVCPTEAIHRGAPADLRGIAVNADAVYWLEGASSGQLVSWSWSTAFTDGNEVVVASGLDARTGAPSTNRIAWRGSQLYVAGSGPVATNNLTIWQITPTNAPPAVPLHTEVVALATPAVDGIAVTADGVYWTRSDSAASQLGFTDLTGVATPITTGGQPRGLATAGGSDVYYGYLAVTPTLAKATHAGGESVVQADVNTRPDRLAALPIGSGTEIVFASEADSSVRMLQGATVTPIYGGGTAGRIDVAVEPSGNVYFFDSAAREIIELRSDGWLFPLAKNVQPYGVAVDPTGAYVYWTDLATGAVMRVVK